MKPLRPGDLRHQLTVRRPSKADNGKGGYVTVWQDIARPWAEVIGLDGREAVMDRVLQGISVYRIRVWYRTDLQPSDQVRFGTIDLNIRSIADPWGTRRELVILADTGSALAGA